MTLSTEANSEIYGLIITRRKATEILLATAGSGWRLPEVEVRPYQRLAPQFAMSAAQSCHAETYCLFVPAIPSATEENPPKRYALIESVKQNDRAPQGAYWVPSSVASREVTLPPEDCASVRSALDEAQRYVAKPQTGAFGRPGWIRELFEWVHTQVAPLGMRLTGDFQQLNGGPTFSLIRMETNGPAVWFKATGKPNLHELPIIICLARLFPRYVPPILAVHSSWNAWLSPEISATTLDQTDERSAWERAAENLARLQIASIGKDAELLNQGCRDLRLPRLATQIDAFLERMAALMALQEKHAPPILSQDQLEASAQGLKEACSRLEALGFPSTLGNADFNPGNILISRETCAFLDWAEGCVSHPFVTFEYLCEHVRRGFPEHDVEAIANAYLRSWREIVSSDALTQARAASPLLAVFARAVASDMWRSSDTLTNPTVAGTFRSLTRRMHREAMRMMQTEKLM